MANKKSTSKTISVSVFPADKKFLEKSRNKKLDTIALVVQGLCKNSKPNEEIKRLEKELEKKSEFLSLSEIGVEKLTSELDSLKTEFSEKEKQIEAKIIGELAKEAPVLKSITDNAELFQTIIINAAEDGVSVKSYLDKLLSGLEPNNLMIIVSDKSVISQTKTSVAKIMESGVPKENISDNIVMNHLTKKFNG